MLAPRGWPLQSLGVIPQICTSLGEQALDAQLTALANGKNLLLPALTAARAARPPVPITTVLNIRNQCPAALGSPLDLTAATAVFANPALYRSALLPAGARG